MKHQIKKIKWSQLQCMLFSTDCVLICPFPIFSNASDVSLALLNPYIHECLEFIFNYTGLSNVTRSTNKDP